MSWRLVSTLVGLLAAVPVSTAFSYCRVIVRVTCTWNDETYTLTCRETRSLFGCSEGGGWGSSGWESGGGGGGAGLPGSPLSPEQTVKLNAAKNQAKRALENRQECADLFADLGADGIVQMGTVTYRSGQGTSRCSSGPVSAWTTMHGDVVYLCSSFVDLASREAGRIIIHELLHTVGLPENPPDPNAMTSQEINNMVAEECGL